MKQKITKEKGEKESNKRKKEYKNVEINYQIGIKLGLLGPMIAQLF